ncbi:MAG TPA: GNAT family N-acetyltransferase [Rhodoferax sp.]|nr:GNAT family N-acetyltransferase [Rhodoferax sp.]
MTFKLWSIGGGTRSNALVWRLLAFDDLRVSELYAVLRLRSEVFVVEQQCVFHDMDGYDPQAMHLLGVQHGQLQAYARCFEAGIKFPEASFGRVLVRQSARGTGLGHTLIEQTVTAISQLWGPRPIRIGAQLQLAAFYGKHGFEDARKPYMEDGIEHLEMIRPD